MCIEAGRVPHTDCGYFEAISKSNMLMKFDRNRKRLRGSYKKLYDIKCIIFALKLYRSDIYGDGVYRNWSCASY